MALCKTCSDAVYLQGFSDGKCKICDTTFKDTHTPAGSICPTCARIYTNVCTQCGKPLNQVRPDKNDYYLDIAKVVAERGTCLRRNYGAIIVKNDEIIATGYTGAPRCRKNCIDLKKCKRQELNIPSGERYELCRSVHAEQNAIISAARKNMIGSTMYLYGYDKETKQEIVSPKPCLLCEKMIINAEIIKIVTRSEIIEVKNLMLEE